MLHKILIEIFWMKLVSNVHSLKYILLFGSFNEIKLIQICYLATENYKYTLIITHVFSDYLLEEDSWGSLQALDRWEQPTILPLPRCRLWHVNIPSHITGLSSGHWQSVQAWLLQFWRLWCGRVWILWGEAGIDFEMWYVPMVVSFSCVILDRNSLLSRDRKCQR